MLTDNGAVPPSEDDFDAGNGDDDDVDGDDNGDDNDDDDDDADYARLSTDVLASLYYIVRPFKHFHRFSLCEHYVNHLLNLGSRSINCHIYVCVCESPDCKKYPTQRPFKLYI